MELLLPTRFASTIYKLSSFCPNSIFFGDFSYHKKLRREPNRILYPLRIALKSEKSSSSNDYLYQSDDNDGEVSWGKDPNIVEVIGIGSRKDALLDFCLDSPFQSSFSYLRFWTIIPNDSLTLQLQQRSVGKDTVLRDMQLPASQLSAPRTVILVASAGYGLDHITAIELLGAVKSAAGLAVVIILKPFSFEGQRRQEEVEELVNKLREHTNFCIVVDTGALLKKELVTLEEALKSANNAVLLSINSIFILMSDRHKKFFDYPQNTKKELEVPELLKLLESSEKATVGFGAGNNIKSSIARAIFDCPFISDGVKELNDVVFCTLASADVIDNSNVHSFLHTLRQTTGWQKEIVVSIVHEPNLEPNIFVTTIIVSRIKRENVSQRTGFLSGLAQRFPFVFSLLGRDHPESEDPLPDVSLENPCAAEDINLLEIGELLDANSLDNNSGSPNRYSDNVQTQSNSNHDENPSLSEYDTEDKRTEGVMSSATEDMVPDVYDQISEGEALLEREPLIWWNVGPSFHIAQEWAKERQAIFGSNPVLNNQRIYTLPVGVKLSEQAIDSSKFANTKKLKSRTSNDENEESRRNENAPSWDALTDAGFEAVMDIYNATSTLLKGKRTDESKKPGLLSMRAASMLEVERDSQKKWAPIIEMQYQGGTYKGRCQGGLPEGKGRLTLKDGSIYDGLWRYGLVLLSLW
ncbi:hypothetical protein AQUCO_00201391v1 [Aquilegia coerulea]|uniref:Protein ACCUMULATION AND REPLICATION OF CHLOROPLASTS 3 n=1 Tax=Aquilegia coerulea TaxID=218851 RepID=A0A2G5F7S3_AQUCA|nr:hypothetical protein AQUCO_00201391v1 [Aquilegia coerulea]